MRLPFPTANEAVSFFRDNWNWIKDRVQDRIDEGQFINGDVAIKSPPWGADVLCLAAPTNGPRWS
jgi:hypothetical protein